MKTHTILTKTVALISCAMLLYAILPQRAQALEDACAADDGLTPAVAAVHCADNCNDLVYCQGEEITPFAGYHTCSTTYDSGVVSCADDSSYEFYDWDTCSSHIKKWGITACAVAYVAEYGVAATTTIAVCYTTGEFTLGWSCAAAIAKTAAALAAPIITCQYCNTHSCKPTTATNAHRYMVTPSHPDSNSGQCPG